jgi:transcriptional regulator, LysR family
VFHFGARREICFMNLESKWLEDFSALASTRSFSQAAERRFVNPTGLLAGVYAAWRRRWA